ncbi:MAG: hypothetical protein J5642_00765 [Bacteroidales bacterium]|nr:hypothetical protein [Bacteroidales bacterium]
MKKLFLVVLAAGMFVACGKKDNTSSNAEGTDSAQVAAPAPAPEAEPVADVPANTENTEVADNKSKEAEIIEASTDAAVSTINAVSEASKASKGRGK